MALCMPWVAMSSKICTLEMSPRSNGLRTPIAQRSPHTVPGMCVCVGVPSNVCRGTRVFVQILVTMSISCKTCPSAPESMTHILPGTLAAIT